MPAAPVPLRFSETARSGTRMLMALPVILEGSDTSGAGFKEKTQTIVINRNGAKVLAAAPLAIGSKMTLTVGGGKGQRTSATVVWMGDKKETKTEIGLEIDQTDGSFWGVLFPDDSGALPPGSLGGASAKPKAEAEPKGPSAAPPVKAQVLDPVVSAPVSTRNSPRSPAQTLPASAPESPTRSEPGIPGVPSIASELIAAKQQLDGHVARTLEQAKRDVQDKINEALRQALAATLEPAVHAAKGELVRLSAQYSQSAQKGVEGISKAAERTANAIEQRALQSAMNTQMVVEQRFQMRLQECETVLASIAQEAAIKTERKVQQDVAECEQRWKQSLEQLIQERVETQLDALQARLLVNAEQVLETQMEEFARRLEKLAASFTQSLARSVAGGPVVKKAATH